uniref:Uncharacterized protein n=1 Tax=Avena sativa TaxID=4498 RepID=A0ACD5Y547_AVESA
MFGEESSLRCNMSKSSASPIRCEVVDLQQIMARLNFPLAPFPVHYLGLPLLSLRLLKKDLQPMVDKVARHIPAWKVGMLEQSGRLILLKSMLNATPIYPMLSLDLPQWFFGTLSKLQRGFFWAREEQARARQCRVAWDMVCSPKLLGGLGVKNLKLMFLALRVRWRWMEHHEDSKPWQDILFEPPEETEHMFKAATRCVLGNGKKLRFWTDIWLDNGSIEDLAPQLYACVKPTRLHDSVA